MLMIIEDIFWVLLTQNRREAHMFYLAREVGKFGHVLAKKKVANFIMINEFKYGQT